MLRVKICGITREDQAQKITKLGGKILGFICVPSSPRYVTPIQIERISNSLTLPVETIGVFANSSLDEILRIVTQTGLSGVQLHGNESLEFCQKLRQKLPQVELIKALRIKDSAALTTALTYVNHVDTLLLDAYHPTQLGGTGVQLDWSLLENFQPDCPWFLAGGLTPVNIRQVLAFLHPDGIDLSSGVESSPGDKDLLKVHHLFIELNQIKLFSLS